MAEDGKEGKSLFPQRAIPKKYILPILFLAERMSSSDGNVAAKEKRLIDELADAVGLKNYRYERSFRTLTDESACEMLDLAGTKTAALVVITLVLKSDFDRKDEEHEFFRKIRGLMGSGPVTVPADLEEHKKLALAYLKN